MENQRDSQLQHSHEKARQTRIVVCLWAIFAAGLLVQMIAPRLKIENNVFVMPPISDARGTTLRPDVLVRRERWMQTASAILTVGGALALGICYRQRLASALRG